jgi:hypothetical protein
VKIRLAALEKEDLLNYSRSAEHKEEQIDK